MGRSKHLFLVAASALALSACEATYTNHGFAPQIAQLEQLSSSDTRGSVLRQLGQPSATGTFNSENWYYQASRVENYAFYAPKIVDRKVVAIRFDQAGRVANVARYGIEEGQIIDLITRTTPTYGREITLLQQLFGNIGRVGADQFFDGRLPGG
ncbi:MAG: outer membrane protein assembly factor BamE [Paracoccaceae bacterium]|jgi:outer membrane protein assembly factor BamE (lipoprotein component of BamABCDE complex)|nr:outer membrane protein assembly factor BamE [Paracoccaceae bacterium]MDG1370209.1 outer membrane protein assembly factor BamE [Paracoccaceae bacterium]